MHRSGRPPPVSRPAFEPGCVPGGAAASWSLVDCFAAPDDLSRRRRQDHPAPPGPPPRPGASGEATATAPGEITDWDQLEVVEPSAGARASRKVFYKAICERNLAGAGGFRTEPKPDPGRFRAQPGAPSPIVPGSALQPAAGERKRTKRAAPSSPPAPPPKPGPAPPAPAPAPATKPPAPSAQPSAPAKQRDVAGPREAADRGPSPPDSARPSARRPARARRPPGSRAHRPEERRRRGRRDQ
jgi:hypothetical protein